MFLKRFRKEKRSHIFCAEYDNGFSQIICSFKNKPSGVRVMSILNEKLGFEELINGNVLDKRVYYFDTPEMKYEEQFPIFQFEKVRNRQQVDDEITNTISVLFNDHARKYNELQTVFDDTVRDAILGRTTFIEEDEQPALSPDDWIE